MLALTRSAHEAIRSLRSYPSLSRRGGLRISLDDDRQSLLVRPASQPAAGDHVQDVDGARVFLGPRAASRLAGRALHVRRDPGGRWQFGVLRGGRREV